MKIDKKKPLHWLLLAMFGLNVILAMAWRKVRQPKTGRSIVLYGHKLNGSLLAIYRGLRQSDEKWNVHFLTMDKQYYSQLRGRGEACVLATSPTCVSLLASADAIVSDHGLHVLKFMLDRSEIKFFDVWHGIPFKGFDSDDFCLQHRYDEIWVASQLMAKMYVERYGFDEKQVKVTGYARTDRLVTRGEDIHQIKRRLGLDGADVGKIVLFAPTWKQDSNHRSVFPFGLPEQEFFQALSDLARRSGSTFVMRAHLNSEVATDEVWDRIVRRPHSSYPDTEELLLISDVLVCDWSSIAFDYLLLQRPTIFLEVEAPFAKGFSLGPEYRFGPVVPDMDGLLQTLESCLEQPASYQATFGERAGKIQEAIYGANATGMATSRCVGRLRAQLSDEFAGIR